MHLSNNLEAWRTSAGISREQLAEKVGISAVSIYRIERGSQQPRPALLDSLCKLFRKPASEFYAAQSNVTAMPDGTRWIPILDFVQAGPMAMISPSPEGEYEDSILTDLNPSLDAFAMRIRGRSMEPEFREGDLILVDPAIDPVAEDFIVVFDEAGNGSFKQYRDLGLNENREHVFEAASLNPAYPSWRSDRKRLKIRGTMIEHRRLRRT